MTLLLIVTALLSHNPAHAASLKMTFSVSSENTYTAVSKTRYRMASGTTTVGGYLSVSKGVIYKKQAIPTATSPSAEQSDIELLSGSRVRLVDTDPAKTIIAKAQFSQDGSFRVSGRVLTNAMKALMRDKVEAAKSELTQKGAHVSAGVRVQDMVCRKSARELKCKLSAEIMLKASGL